ncbi:MAG: FUSC family protein [Nocardioidaceae bacterium]
MDLSELSDRAWERGRLSAAARLRRLESKAWMIGQCAIAAGVAWSLGRLAGHPSPFFAPTAAVLCLGTSYGQRLRRVAEVSLGCSIGIGIADLFVRFVGQGAWQISAVVAVSMSAAVLLDAGVLFIGQVAVQSIVVSVIFPPDGGLSRIEDALIGGAVALVAASVVPRAPLRRPREEAATVVRELARVLRSARDSSDEVDADQATDTLDLARETEGQLNDLREAAHEGLEVARTSPFRPGAREQVRSIADLVGPIDRALRNTRVMIRRIVISARLEETMPPEYLRLLDRVAEAADMIAAELEADRLPERAQSRLVETAELTGGASEPLTLSAAVVLAQLRSVVVDLLELSGMDYEEAAGHVPARS